MDHLDTSAALPPVEAPRDEIEIRQENAITISEALLIADEQSFPLGKSTLQRWAKAWHVQGAASAVKAVLVTNRFGTAYKLDRDDFEAWLLEQAENNRSREISRGPLMPHEASGDPVRPRKASQDPMRSAEASQGGAAQESASALAERVKELEDENLQLKIDVGIRKELITRARDEMLDLRKATDELLRENGALHYQIAQLGAPTTAKVLPPAAEVVDGDHQQGTVDKY